MMLDICTNGASFPTDSPPTMANISPRYFARNVLYVKYLGSTTPDNTLFISGNPDPFFFVCLFFLLKKFINFYFFIGRNKGGWKKDEEQSDKRGREEGGKGGWKKDEEQSDM